jgi:hypothetical protein
MQGGTVVIERHMQKALTVHHDADDVMSVTHGAVILCAMHGEAIVPLKITPR